MQQEAWLSALLYPVVWLHSRLLAFVRDKDYELWITPQVCYLNRLLNDRFDPLQRRIFIADPIEKQPSYLYQVPEKKPLFLGGEPIYTDGEAGLAKNDFVIYLPVGLVYDVAEMQALINLYKLAAMRYTIQTI